MIAVTFEERDYHDSDYDVIQPVFLFQDRNQAIVWLQHTKYVPAVDPDTYKKVDYHSERIATLHRVVDMGDKLAQRPTPGAIVQVLDSEMHAIWVGFYDPTTDALIPSLKSPIVTVNWQDVESWEELRSNEAEK